MKEALRLLLELQNTSGTNAKKSILASGKDHEPFRRLLFYALNPFLTYKVSEKTLRSSTPYNAAITLTMTNIFEVCETLSGRKALDDVTVYQVKSFLDLHDCDTRELYIKILSKTIRLGVTAKTVNKVIPGLIPEWEVQQAYPIEKYPIKPGTWFALSQKLNGIRATFYKGKLYARSGEVFEGLNHIENDLAAYTEGYVFDGELTLRDPGELSDNEAFRMAAGIINSEAGNKTAISFTVFDIIPIREFEGEGTTGYYARQKLMDLFRVTIDSDHVRVLESLYQGTDQSMINKLLDRMVSEDKEGLVVNLDVPYQRKRHKGILKVKRFYTMDLPIIRCEEGSGRLSGTLGAFVVDYMGNEVSVGSGFTDAQRDEFWGNRDELPGVLCEVKYKEVSSDKNTGAKSLQFPVFVGLRTDKTEPSFG